VTFDADAQSSDGGVILLAELDRKIELTGRLAACLDDPRQQAKVEHDLLGLLRERIYAIALGYPDATDCERLADDAALKVALDRLPVRDVLLASQSTISRFENTPSGRELVQAQRALEDVVIGRLKRRHRRARKVYLDFDPSHDEAHGAQQGVLFNGFYDGYGYLPMFGFLSVAGDPEQYLLLARLRPGTRKAFQSFIPSLRRIVRKVRAAFPRAQVIVRLDSEFTTPRILDALEDEGVKYVAGLKNNAKLKKLAAWHVGRARGEARRTGHAARRFKEFRYQARTWRRARRVILKAEVLVHPTRGLKDNPRWIVTNLRHKPENAYAIYCGRGDAENRVKELKLDLHSDRTSCHRFLANQLRLLMASAAYVLMQDLRWQLRKTHLKRARVGRIRLLLLKVAAQVKESVRRIVLHLPRTLPERATWIHVARRLGAVPSG
jgi:hypothetical protein